MSRPAEDEESKSDAQLQVPKGYGDPAREPQPAPGKEETPDVPDQADISEGNEVSSGDTKEDA